MEKRVWFITGVSSGLGKALAETVIENGDFVVATFRNIAEVEDFDRRNIGNGKGILMDVTKLTDIENAFQFIQYEIGTIDILVNNAGVGFVGAIEETLLSEAKDIFEVNFFSALKITQLALPFFRKNNKGHIFQISSGAGIKATAGFGVYNASKFALEGFSEALADEIRPFNIKLTIVEPGPFRTNFAGKSLKVAQKEMVEYANTAGVFKKKLMEVVNNHQEGNPEKAAKIILDVSKLENPPLRLPLGKIVISNIESKISSVQNDLNNWRKVAESAIYE
jgi:short-subunit dehydrogenase